MNDFTLTAIIVAAGAGTRLKARLPKAFIPLGKQPMYQYSLETFASHTSVRDVVIVVPKGMVTATQQSVKSMKTDKSIFAVAGGKERWHSVQNGVAATDADWVMVHDAARPFVTDAVIDGVLEKCFANDCVITATQEVDTIRALSGEFAGNIIDRSTLIRTGTPQLFRRAVLVEAFHSAATLASPPTDEAALMQQCGIPVAIAWGDPANFKITSPSDLAIAEAIVAQRR
jgi:2-C-methyl-D-erythritol 4-phosphate cytidylyltransferase